MRVHALSTGTVRVKDAFINARTRPTRQLRLFEVHVETLERILAHGREHATVYLPTHDPESAQRLAGNTLL